jgi:hypothetical protein
MYFIMIVRLIMKIIIKIKTVFKIIMKMKRYTFVNTHMSIHRYMYMCNCGTGMIDNYENKNSIFRYKYV